MAPPPPVSRSLGSQAKTATKSTLTVDQREAPRPQKEEAPQTTTNGPVLGPAPARASNATPAAPRATPVAPRALVVALDNLSARSIEAERERARMRADARQVEHLRIKLTDAEARLQLEKRARGAAETRAQLAYDQGYRDGVQITQAQMQAPVFAWNPLPPGGMMPFQAFTGTHTQSANGIETPNTCDSYPTPQNKSANVWSRKDVVGQSSATPSAPSAEHAIMENSFSDPQYKFTGAPQETEMLNGMLDDLLENGQVPRDTAGTSTAQQAVSTPAPSSWSGSRINSAADPRLKSLRERALATTAAYRDKQAADKWLEENSSLARAGCGGGETGEMRGKKRGREEADSQDGVGGAQEDSEGLRASAANAS